MKRLALLALLTAPGCGLLMLAADGETTTASSSSSSTSSGTGGAGGEMGDGGDGGPQIAEAAWSVTMIQSDPTQCMIADNTRQLGSVSASQITMTEADGAKDGTLGLAAVQCIVSGTSTFSVDAQASAGPDDLHITIPAITASASASKPATGTVSYASDATAANPYQGTCNFYFLPSMDMPVAAGRIWVAFQCPAVMSGLSTCPIEQGYAVFEDCEQN